MRVKNLFIIGMTILVCGCMSKNDRKIIEEAWRTGQTLPVGIGKKYPPEPINMTIDKGYNVLIDLSHQCLFNYMWNLPDMLHQKGYRSVPSQASLHTVLDEKGVSRIRIPYDKERKRYPFAWYPNFKYNVIVTLQNDPSAPVYTEQECRILADFVKQGGGLIVLADPVNPVDIADWSINRLLGVFDAAYTTHYQTYKNRNHIGLSLSSEWSSWEMGSDSLPIRACRNFGKGKIVVGTALDDFLGNGEGGNNFIDKTMDLLCKNQTPVGGEPRLPQTMGGGGSIYPELESVTSGMVVYYTPKINSHLLECIEKEFPKITEMELNWYPSKWTEEPMYLILLAGNGGGWAVNSFKPKENGIISQSPDNLISIYAHELAHTLDGPVNSKNQTAGKSPIENQGEAHAGWFQGKIEAMYREELRNCSNKKCDDYFQSPEFMKLDLKKYGGNNEYMKQFIYGADWKKLWYIWQRLDDTYGSAWYTRWKYLQHTRWEDEPMRKLSWEETVEDMSLAVGADLFPFFISLNTGLGRKEMGEVEYKGKKITLPRAQVEMTAPGAVCLDAVTDYELFNF